MREPKELERLYLEWFNNYLTTEKFAEHYNLGIAECENILDEGRKINHKRKQDDSTI